MEHHECPEATYKFQQTSASSAVVNDIVLRETKTTRLIFRPLIVDNENNSEAAIKGTFIFQRHSKNDVWVDHNELPLNTLKQSEWVNLPMNSEEILKLYKGLSELYRVYQETGIPQGNMTAIITHARRTEIIKKILEDPTVLNECNDVSVLSQCLKNFSGLNWAGFQKVIDRLAQMDITDLDNINSAAGIARIQKVSQIWHENRFNNSEEFWQKAFSQYPWILEQIFASPVVVMQEKAFVGGKGIENSGGKVVDFLCQNKATGNVALIEIKTPGLSLVSNTAYRAGIFSAHSELTGAVNQVLHYKDSLYKEFAGLSEKSQKPFCVFNPKCVIIAGTMDDILADPEKVQSFELYRQELKNVEIVTFDELFDKVTLLSSIFEG